MFEGDLGAILAPVSVGTFLSEVLGQRVIRISGGRQKMSGLLSWGAVNQLISREAVLSARLRMTKGGERLAPEGYSSPAADGTRLLSVASFNAQMRGGAVWHLDDIDQIHEPIRIACRAVEASLEVPAAATACGRCCEGTSEPFGWRDRESLILQVEGTSNWRLHPPTVKYPVANSQQPQPAAQASQMQEFLEAGDVLYVPRGWWHSRETEPGVSIEVAICFRNPTGLDIVRRLVAQMEGTEVFRMDVPRFATMEAQSHYIPLIQVEIARVVTEPGLVLGLLKDTKAFCEPTVVTSLPWVGAGGAEGLPGGCHVVPLTRFAKPEALTLNEVAGVYEMCHDGRIVRLERHTGRILEGLLEGGPSSVTMVIERHRVELTSDEVLASVLELTSAGVVALRSDE